MMAPTVRPNHPQDDGLEIDALGHALFHDNPSHVTTHPVSVFWEPRHQRIADAVRRLGERGDSIQPVNVAAFLGTGADDEYLALLYNRAGLDSTIETTWRQLAELHRRRQMMDVASELVEAARDGRPTGQYLERLTATQSQPCGTSSVSLVDWSTFWTEDTEVRWLAEPFLAHGRGHVLFASRVMKIGVLGVVSPVAG